MELNMDCIVPIDSFVRVLPKRRGVCIGVGFLASRRSGLEVFRGLDLVGQLALGWMGQSHSGACVVRGTDRTTATKSAERGLQEVYWEWLGESGKDPSECSGQVLRDVAGLTKIRGEHGLVLIELGSTDSPTALQASRLCDGLVLVAQAAEQCLGKSKAQLGSFERSDCRWLGYWTVDSV
jgi:hypothetical protein